MMTNTQKANLEHCRKLCELQLSTAKAWEPFHKLNMELPELEMDVMDVVADMLGMPADNTLETHACDIANETGVWPEGAYCRDAVWYEWDDVERGKKTIDEFLSALCLEGASDS